MTTPGSIRNTCVSRTDPCDYRFDLVSAVWQKGSNIGFDEQFPEDLQ